MDALIEDFRSTLLADHDPPCVSLYQPTHLHHPENTQDRIRFRNLVKTMTDATTQRFPQIDSRGFFEPFEALAEDHSFWNHTLDGLAVLRAPGVFRVYAFRERCRSWWL